MHQLIQRDAMGKKKYGTSMDRGDLSTEEWAQHAVEEALDLAGYLTALIRETKLQREQIAKLHKASQEYALFRRMVLRAMEDAGKLKGDSRYTSFEERAYADAIADMTEALKHAIDKYDIDALLRYLPERAPSC